MRAVVCRDLAGVAGLSLERRPLPDPGPGKVRIRVRAAGVNFADTLVIEGKYQEKPALPFVPGFEVAGRIDAIGAGVDADLEGARVLAVIASGGYADHALAPASDVVRLTDAIDEVTAAGFAIAYGSSHGALRWEARLQPGETLVVHGASGGVGLAAVECGKAMGARVIATCRGVEKGRLAREKGADHVLDTDTDDLVARIKKLTEGRGADVVFDPVGKSVEEASLRGLGFGGRWLVVGFAGGGVPALPANILLVKNLAVHGFNWGGHRRHQPGRVAEGLTELLAWHGEGRLRPHVSHRVPLADYARALDLLRSRTSTGKVVLTMT
ncbi:NADPH:quinone oxidoreductase family protein [Marinivivus vitaminiproducens]|uniref:NADPH:quinone oxidoreductase family protein n=1 Tax=Marinivivus vitaminiproducens TaxID=3035935 RepID=UPI0027A39A1C|nr:NADPH:quinone oxidoreductase family protein [Geminicoccaceae bacterium SCSIO 64248]